jgi:tetratricopeptide (TPR) repeat protein
VEKALEQYRESLKIRQRLAAADPRDARAQRDLSVSFDNIGDVLLQQGEVEKALEQYREGLKIAQRLAAADPRNFEAQTDLVGSHAKIGLAEKQALRHAEAIASFEKALAALRPWQQAGKLKGTSFAVWPGLFEKELGVCQLALKALGNLDTLVKLPAEQALPLLELRAQLLAQQGKHAEAAAAADKLAGLANRGDQHFLAARAFAWCSRDKANEDRHARRVLACLSRAQGAGFFKDSKNIERLRSDAAFKPLLSRADFKKRLADLETNR